MRKLFLVIVVVSSILIQACAHSTTEKKLDEKMSQETAVKSRLDLSTEATQMINEAVGLSDDQKSKLLALRDSMREQNDSFTSQSLKLRSVLIRDLISADYDAKEVALIKKKIKALESKRVSALFDAIEKANAILGREAMANQKIIQDFSEFRGSRSY